APGLGGGDGTPRGGAPARRRAPPRDGGRRPGRRAAVQQRRGGAQLRGALPAGARVKLADELAAVVLGVVEGATEFIPVSSTGHLIVASDLIGFTGAAATTFQVFIQLGAILAVAWLYRARLARAFRELRLDAGRGNLAVNLALGFLPA